MSDTDEKTFRSLVELWNNGRVDDLLDRLGADFIFTPDPRFPEAGPIQGDAMRRWFHEWADIWENSELDVSGLSERGGALVAECSWHLTVAKTALEVPMTEFSLVLWFDDGGSPTSLQAFFDHGRALAAADAGQPG